VRKLLFCGENRTFRLWWGLAGIALLLGLMLIVGPYSDGVAFLPDAGIAWYFWQRPDPDVWSRASAWAGYSLHQVSLWTLIFAAQSRRPGYTRGLHPINIAAITVNVLFVLLHILQTKVWYDGLAQDTSVFSSQASVVLMLVMVLIMENQRRGLVFGKKMPLSTSVASVVRRYHGYYFSWAVVYTFWFHPIEINIGHMLGNAYILMLLLQGSLFFTRTHTNRFWTVALEVTVLIHGAMIAYLSTQEAAAMFVFGFLAIFVITQMHGLGWSRRTRSWVAALSVTAMLIWYRGDWLLMLDEVLRIPLAEYVIAFVLAGLIWLLLAIVRRTRV
jgi:hypothetical protein